MQTEEIKNCINSKRSEYRACLINGTETYVTGEERARGGLASEGWAQWEHVR